MYSSHAQLTILSSLNHARLPLNLFMTNLVVAWSVATSWSLQCGLCSCSTYLEVVVAALSIIISKLLPRSLTKICPLAAHAKRFYQLLLPITWSLHLTCWRLHFLSDGGILSILILEDGPPHSMDCETVGYLTHNITFHWNSLRPFHLLFSLLVQLWLIHHHSLEHILAPLPLSQLPLNLALHGSSAPSHQLCVSPPPPEDPVPGPQHDCSTCAQLQLCLLVPVSDGVGLWPLPIIFWTFLHQTFLLYVFHLHSFCLTKVSFVKCLTSICVRHFIRHLEPEMDRSLPPPTLCSSRICEIF